jgi:DNA-binding FadR family transcriptional regulator
MTNLTVYVRLYEKVSQDLARQIARGDYPVGARLPAERQLAQDFNVSRPTVREAIIALEVDGLVEVRKGSGVYVTATTAPAGHSTGADAGPFELIEARRAIEGETAALAATRITDDQLIELRSFVSRMAASVDAVEAEVADRLFHEAIARATLNSAMLSAVENLWESRLRSPQYRLLAAKAHDAGVKPSISEHEVIIAALAARNPDAARTAMRVHLGRVLAALLEATEVHEVELVRQRVASERQRYT